MISLPNPKTFSTQTMTESDLLTLKHAYADYIIDGMDMDCLMQLAKDMIMDNLLSYTEEELATEISELYDDETLDSLMEEIGATKASKLNTKDGITTPW